MTHPWSRGQQRTPSPGSNVLASGNCKSSSHPCLRVSLSEFACARAYPIPRPFPLTAASQCVSLALAFTLTNKLASNGA
ncbi:hypothetical protein BDW68DRAFT_167681 [Aspergillus falconensis]